MYMRIIGIILIACLSCLAACSFSYNYNGTSFSCSNNSECPAGFTCTNNTCVAPNAGQCNTTGDCPTNNNCINGVCTPEGGDGGVKTTCIDDADCGLGGYCVDKLCYRGAIGDRCSSTVQCQSPGDCQDLSSGKTCLQQCRSHADCKLDEACRPPLTGGNSVCVPRCLVVEQQDCQQTEVCVLSKGRGYCQTRRGAKKNGQLCAQDVDCESHLYCRPVKGFTTIRRCTNVCNARQQTGCDKRGQRCIELSQEETPYGFCEPTPTEVQVGEICGGDLVCPTGSKCTPEAGGLARCK